MLSPRIASNAAYDSDHVAVGPARPHFAVCSGRASALSVARRMGEGRRIEYLADRRRAVHLGNACAVALELQRPLEVVLRTDSGNGGDRRTPRERTGVAIHVR